ncbi:Mov34/MPN/PAD-1 family protein [uncultured Methanosphaera sp.]|uniref:Mov34/MPN/PAD-1 family protein n=1 Tax=uncultured Methanosphaera sp. TaxID=262501 RepID=UPI0025F237C7|nr:Mov34/MPN/PAD-1 family protein [uncultured Methanosphaera sp.]
MNINNTLSKLLGNDKNIKEVQIDQRVIDEIIKIAINADPKEFVALLSGKTEDEILKITGLIFLPFKASDTSAVMQVFMKPLTTDAVGSVHSHPGPSAQPSNADLSFFGKNGFFHMIICRPYSQATIRAYDAGGTPMSYVIKDLGDEVEIKDWNELDGEFFDDELISELKELENQEDEEDMDNDSNNEDYIESADAEVVPNEPAMISLQLESNGQIINQQLPLPPEYEPGDQIEVDIRTDQTPGDSIDEIVLNVIKSNDNPNIVLDNEELSDSKSSEEIDREIKEMESDIAKIKKENKRLRDDLDN